jgi:hypothetical protein
MVLLLNGPTWFWGYDIIFSIVSILTTLLIMFLSFKAYKITKDSKYKFFSLAFLFISLAHLAFSFFNAIMIFHLSGTIYNLLQSFDIGFFIYLFFTLLAYMILIIIIYKIKDNRVVALLLSLTLLFVLFANQHILKFHIVSLVLLAFLAFQFYFNFKEKGNKNSKLVFTSFYLLLTSEVFFLVNLYTNEYLYVVAQLIQLLGYLVLFYMFMRVLTYGSEKREA